MGVASSRREEDVKRGSIEYSQLPQNDPDKYFVARPPARLPRGPMAVILTLTMFLFAVFVSAVVWPMVDPEARPPPPTAYYAHSDLVGLVVTSVFFLLFISSFALTSVTDPGRVPRTYPWDPKALDPNSTDFFIPAFGLRGVERKLDGRTRFCKKCNCYKPDRTHHCRKLGTCVLQMDHWCPWVRQTIGYFNRKYFFLALTHAIASLFAYLIVLGPYLVFAANHAQHALDYLIVFSCIVASLELALLLSFWSFHVFLTVHSFTTIEFREKHKANESKVAVQTGERVRDLYKDSLYDVGVWHAFTQLLGPYVLLWLIPTRYGMDSDPNTAGLVFPTKPNHPLLEQARSGTSFKLTSAELAVE